MKISRLSVVALVLGYLTQACAIPAGGVGSNNDYADGRRPAPPAPPVASANVACASTCQPTACGETACGGGSSCRAACGKDDVCNFYGQCVPVGSSADTNSGSAYSDGSNSSNSSGSNSSGSSGGVVVVGDGSGTSSGDDSSSNDSGSDDSGDNSGADTSGDESGDDSSDCSDDSSDDESDDTSDDTSDDSSDDGSDDGCDGDCLVARHHAKEEAKRAHHAHCEQVRNARKAATNGIEIVR